MRVWKSIPYIILALFFGAIVLTGCEGSETDGNGGGGSEQDRPISLLKATGEDISNHKVECQNKKEDKICILICHKPPGNPENSHSKILPLAAVIAHLEHGGPHHAEHDTLGYCDEDTDDDGDDGDDGSGDDSDDTGDDNGDLPPDDENDLPAFCEDNMDLDADCDGVADDSGELMY